MKALKKVGILSMQRIANYGSFLQAYGLKCMLEDLHYEVQFVDYHPGQPLIKPNGIGISQKIFKIFSILKCKASLKDTIKYIKFKKNYGARNFPYLGIEDMNYSPQLDVLIIGSDEVFNCVQSNADVGFTSDLFGVGSNAKKLMTYAASFGNTTIEKLEKYKVKDKVKLWLNKIDTISVRDKNSEQIIMELTKNKPQFHLDPVLAYDFIGRCHKIPKNVKKGKYILLYGYTGRFNKEECKKIKEYADNKGLNVYCIGGMQGICDEFIDCSPFEVISYFQHAKCIITDTFHGTILSVISHKKFVVIIRNKGYGNSEKISDLVNKLKLNDRVISDLSKLDSVMHNDINYEYVDEVLIKERKRSYAYLKNEIEV